MAVTVSYLVERFNAAGSEAEVSDALTVAIALVDMRLANAWRPVPPAIRDECIIRVAYAVFKTLGTNSSGDMLGADGTTYVGVANDPLQKAWPLMSAYVDRV